MPLGVQAILRSTFRCAEVLSRWRARVCTGDLERAGGAKQLIDELDLRTNLEAKKASLGVPIGWRTAAFCSADAGVCLVDQGCLLAVTGMARHRVWSAVLLVLACRRV